MSADEENGTFSVSLFIETADNMEGETQVQERNTLSNHLLDVYRCRNGEVISILGRCNDVTDCFDHSDEENCRGTTGMMNVCGEETINDK